jgi:beta-glucosidase
VDLSVAGRGNLFIDKQLVVDLTTNPPKGEAFLGYGTSPVRATLKNVKAGQTYNIEVRVDNTEFAAQSLPFPCWGGIRMGGMKHIDEKAALQKAVQLANDSDGRSACIPTAPSSLISASVAILVVGLNHE